MAVKAVPEGFHTITPYLIAKDAAKLIEFLKRALGAQVRHQMMGPDGLVMHASLKIGDSMLMLTDARDKWPAQPASFYLYVDDAEAWYRRAIDAGAQSFSEPKDQFYGDRIGGVTDPMGNMWWFATHIEDVSDEEMDRRREKMFAGNK
jgi:PhnB protein